MKCLLKTSFLCTHLNTVVGFLNVPYSVAFFAKMKSTLCLCHCTLVRCDFKVKLWRASSVLHISPRVSIECHTTSLCWFLLVA